MTWKDWAAKVLRMRALLLTSGRYMERGAARKDDMNCPIGMHSDTVPRGTQNRGDAVMLLWHWVGKELELLNDFVEEDNEFEDIWVTKAKLFDSRKASKTRCKK